MAKVGRRRLALLSGAAVLCCLLVVGVFFAVRPEPGPAHHVSKERGAFAMLPSSRDV